MRIATLLFASTFLVGCGATIIVDDAGQPAGDGVTLGAACDKAGALACNGSGQKLQLLCDGAHWIQNGVCAGSLVCDPRPGSTAGSCQEPLAPCVAHGAGSSFCDGVVRKTCAPDLLSTTDVKCGSASLCESSKTSSCAACVDGAHACDGAVLKMCKGGAFLTETKCDGTVCDAKAGSCRPKVCEPDAWRCNGNTLEHCNMVGTEWDTVALCGGSCDAAMHQCVACPYMGKDCVGDVPRTCGPLGAWIVEPACTDGCKDGECLGSMPTTCTPFDYRCTGDTLERCLDDGSGFAGVATCAPGTCDAISKSCGSAPADCSLTGLYDCMGDTPRVCDDTLHWKPLTPCTGATICFGGKCTETSVGKVLFPAKTSKSWDGVSTSAPLTPKLEFSHSGAFVQESFPRTTPMTQLLVSFQMTDNTPLVAGCTGKSLSWDVYVGSVKVGSFSWVTGTSATQVVSQTFTFPAIAPSSGTVLLQYVATTEIASGCGSYSWVVGGSASLP